MSHAFPTEEIKIGTRLKHLRRLRGLSLKEVAESAGCSEGYMSKIENDKAAPSLATLHRIVSALDTNLAYLFDSKSGEDAVVSPAGSRPIIDLDPLRRGKGLRLERVIPYSEAHLLQCNVHIVEPGGTSEGQIEHEGEEVGYVLEGEIELHLEDKAYQLKAGDAFYFHSSRPHGYRNPGDRTARIFWVNTPPTF